MQAAGAGEGHARPTIVVFGPLERVWARSDLGENEAMGLGVSEQQAMRDEKRAARRP